MLSRLFRKKKFQKSQIRSSSRGVGLLWTLSGISVFKVAPPPWNSVGFGTFEIFSSRMTSKATIKHTHALFSTFCFQLSSKLKSVQSCPAMRLTLNTKGFFHSSADQIPFTFYFNKFIIFTRKSNVSSIFQESFTRIGQKVSEHHPFENSEKVKSVQSTPKKCVQSSLTL